MKSVIAYLAVVLAFLAPSAAFGQETPAPREWRQFRDIYPYHVQGVAVSKPRADGSRVVIVAEPPPHMGSRTLAPIFAGATDLQYPVQRIGYDGWVRDAVAVLPAERAGAVGAVVDALHREMFGTTYKAFVLPTEPRPAPPWPGAAALNLRVSAADLARWLLPPAGVAGGPMRFTRLGSPTAVSVSDVLNRGLAGVFVSSQPGLVLCSVSSSAPLADARIDLRRFALDSDLILGAIRKGTQVVLVGRERVVPVTVLPPLRVETILQLASVERDELSQSYERTNFAAGRYDDAHDWAPIYLSPALVDTEYGSLLNITDQLLKSWSMRGQIKYARFAYPAPGSYPFPKPLLEQVQAPRVTFNWNTKGAGYVVEERGVEILASSRTGALPVDYLGDQDARLLDAEDRGYDYFSTTGDPNLVRVVQYASLYQAFRRFGVTTPATRVSPPIVTSAALREAATSLVRRLRAADGPKLLAEYEKQRTNPRANPRLLAEMKDLLRAMSAIERLQEKGGDVLLRRLADALAGPRDFPLVTADDEAVLLTAYDVMHAPVQTWLRIPLKPIMDQYVKESTRSAPTWIRTPSVVVSWSERPDGSTGHIVGGHNLSARTSSMRADVTVPMGGLRVVESPTGRVLLFNPADESRIGSVVRQFGRGLEKPPIALEAGLKATLRSTVPVERPLAEALAFKTAPSGTRGLTAQHLPAGVADVGWRYTDTVPSATQVETIRALAAPQSPVWILERTGNGTLSIYSESGRPVLAAGNTVSGADALADVIRAAEAQSGPIRLHVRGLDTNQAKGIIQSVETRLPPQYRGRLAGTVEDGLLGPQDLRRVMAADYDFARARVSRVSDAVRTAEGTAIHMDISVPARLAGKPSLMMRIKLLFRSVFDIPAQLRASAERLVRTWAATIDPGLSPGALGAAKQRLRTDLKSVHPELDVDIVLNDSVFITQHLNGLVDAIAAAA